MALSRSLLLPATLANLLREQPGITVDVLEGSYLELVELLRSGKIDILIGALREHPGTDLRKRGRQTADYAACATRSAVCADQFQGMSSSHRAAGQSAAIFPVTSAM